MLYQIKESPENGLKFFNGIAVRTIKINVRTNFFVPNFDFDLQGGIYQDCLVFDYMKTIELFLFLYFS